MNELLHLREADLAWRAVHDEVVALHLPGSEYFGVNASGTVLWEALAKGTTRAALVQRLVEEYALSVESAERDADAFLAELQRRGLLDGCA